MCLEVSVLKRILIPLLLSSLLLPTAAAQSAPPKNVQFTLSQDLVRRSVVAGKTTESFVENPKTVLPGDVLREQVILTNTSGRRTTGLLVNVPVPAGTEFSELTTTATARWKVLYSLDRGKTFSAAPTRTVTVTENGKAVTRTVPALPSSYTNVRWTVATLEPDETLKFSFRVKVK